ncbi:hypothetical protein [Lyngbya sp. PCC 8106]|nr:hypothetical protein [Lyngbya sp. PCC 8106]
MSLDYPKSRLEATDFIIQTQNKRWAALVIAGEITEQDTILK